MALPKSTSELWERAELCPIATNKLDESWENDSDGDHRQGKNLARSDRLVNEFGMKNPHGMNRENAFVNGQM